MAPIRLSGQNTKSSINSKTARKTRSEYYRKIKSFVKRKSKKARIFLAFGFLARNPNLLLFS
jgi:hypothetical protein